MKIRRSKRSRNGGERNSEPIPFDLVFEILTRLPANSIARFRCISKLWGSTLRCPSFTESFFTMPLSSPKVLFTCSKNGETFFFSSPQSQQPRNPSPIAANFYMKFPINDPYAICRGLVCGKNQRNLEGVTIPVLLVCNPSTGQFLTLPEVKTIRKQVIIYFGYDPIHKKFKVLCMSKSMLHNRPYYSQDHQVLTLGTRKELSWRMIKCDIPHRHVPIEYRDNRDIYDGMCINGVCYYFAIVKGGDGFRDIVCFDIRFEKFKCIRKAQGMRKNFQENRKGTLVKYKGKLAMLQVSIVDGIYTGIKLWVLEDAEKYEWSSYIYVLPPPWKNIFEENKLYFVGTVSTGEIVLSEDYISDSFYFLYYNPERNTITKVEIQGMEAFKYHKVFTCLQEIWVLIADEHSVFCDCAILD